MSGPLTLTAAPVHIAGDELGRSYTPDHVAMAICARLRTSGWLPVHPTVLEPCVGGGAFVRAAEEHLAPQRVTGIDLDPGAPGFELCDATVVGDATEAGPLGFDLALTNPPFGKAVGQKTTLAIAQRARAAADVCVLLVPLDYLTQTGWAELVAACVEVWPVIGRVWEHERGMVVLVWVAWLADTTPAFRPLRVRS